jgi:hypothetical protein
MMQGRNIKGGVVDEAIEPVFARLIRLDDGMILRVGMLPGMATGAGIATANMAANRATAQVDPPALAFHAFDAPWSAGGNFLNQTDMRASLAHGDSH